MNVSIIATYRDSQGAAWSEPGWKLTPTPSPTPQEDDCIVKSITVQWQRGRIGRFVVQPVRRVNGVSVVWLITIKGEKLKKCEFTQFISANTQLWDPAGKELPKEDVLAAFKACGPSRALIPFARYIT
jgi:hypothetical protein